jgi:hypothetical protein
MRISRTELKKIVKECLVELLAEGLADSTQSLSESLKRPTPSVARVRTDRGVEKSNPAIKSFLEEHAKSLAQNDPVMESILKDTAQNTFETQLKAEGQGPTDAMGQVVANHSPDELFGSDTVDMWANLAFASGPSKK